MALTQQEQLEFNSIQQHRQKQEMSTLQNMLQSVGQSPPGQLLLGIGDETMSLGSKVASTISQKLGGPEVPEWEPTGIQGPYYEAARFGTGMIPYLYGQTPIGRLATAGVAGYLTHPENPEAGGEEGLLMGTLGEAINPVVGGLWRGGKHLVNKVTGDLAKKEIPQMVKKGYETARDEAYGLIEPYYKKFGEKRLALKSRQGFLEGSPEFHNFERIFEDKSKLIDYSSRKFYDEVFTKRPTLNNAKEMASQLKNDIRELRNKPHLEDIDKARIDEMMKAKDALESSIVTSMKHHSVKAANPKDIESITKNERMITTLERDIEKLKSMKGGKKVKEENAFDIDRMTRKVESLKESNRGLKSQNLLDFEEIHPKYLAQYAREVGPYSKGNAIYKASQGLYPSLGELSEEISENLVKRTSEAYPRINPEHALAGIGKEAEKSLAWQSLYPEMVRKYTPGNERFREWAGGKIEKYAPPIDALLRSLIESQATGE